MKKYKYNWVILLMCVCNFPWDVLRWIVSAAKWSTFLLVIGGAIFRGTWSIIGISDIALFYRHFAVNKIDFDDLIEYLCLKGV